MIKLFKNLFNVNYSQKEKQKIIDNAYNRAIDREITYTLIKLNQKMQEGYKL